MIWAITKVKYTPGHGEQAWEWARTVARVAKTKLRAQVECLSCIAGDNYEITVVGRYDSLQAMMETHLGITKDPEYQAVQKKMPGAALCDSRTSLYSDEPV